MQIGLVLINTILPNPWLNNVALQWVFKLKYLGIWFFGGKTFGIDTAFNQINFYATFSVMQKYGYLSEEVK